MGVEVAAVQQEEKKSGQRHRELADGLENTFTEINFSFRAAPDRVFSQLRLMQFGETELLSLEKLFNTVAWTGISDHFPTPQLSALRDGCLEYKTCQAKISFIFGNNNNIQKVYLFFFFYLFKHFTGGGPLENLTQFSEQH